MDPIFELDDFIQNIILRVSMSFKAKRMGKRENGSFVGGTNFVCLRSC